MNDDKSTIARREYMRRYHRAYRKRHKELIADLQETIALQDAEIARLKRRVNKLLRSRK